MSEPKISAPADFYVSVANSHNIIIEKNIKSDNIWNFDEKSIMIGMGSLLAEMHTLNRKDGNRDNITIIDYVNATFTWIMPPIIVFKSEHHMLD